MPLLTLKPQTKPHTLKINLDVNTLERLKNYCDYAHGDMSSAVREALIYVFDRDKDFRAHEQQLRERQAAAGGQNANPASAEPDTSGTRSKS